MKFDEFDLDDKLLRAIDDLGFEECTEVQERSLAHTLNWRDVTAQSQTGTGKTAAFLLTVFQHLLTKPELEGRQALVITPTRELAVQIEEEARQIGKYLPYRAGSIYGGVGYGPQEQMLRDNVEIIVGTPGRLIDLSKSGKLDFGNFAFVVIDEADRLFDMGFYPDIRYILKRTPPKEKRLTLLFSATLSTSVRNISWQYMNDPEEIEVAPEHITVQEVDQVLYHVARDEKISLLLGILEKEKPENALIFTNTKRAAELIAKKLKGNGYQCEFIMGDVPQRKRLRIINNLKSGSVPYLVATDVAARGLHIEDLDLVVNYDLPEDVESYVHRIGRTARAGKTGKAVSLACERFVYSLESIEEFVGFKIPVGTLSDDLFVDDRSHVSMRDLQYHGDDRGRSGSRSRPGGRSRGTKQGTSRRPASSRSRGARSGGPRSDDSRRNRDSAPARAASHGGERPKNEERPPKRERRPQRGGKPSSPDRTPDRGPSKSASMDERLEYYKQKYGEDFQHAGTASGGGDGKDSQKKSDGSSRADTSRKGRQRSRGGSSSTSKSGSEHQRAAAPSKGSGRPGSKRTRPEPASPPRSANAPRHTAAEEAGGPRKQKGGLMWRLARLLGKNGEDD